MANRTREDKAIDFLKKKSEYIYSLHSDAAFLAKELGRTGQEKSEELYSFYSAMPDSDINKFRMEILEIMRKGKRINKYSMAMTSEKYFENFIFTFPNAFFDILFPNEEQILCREYLSMLAESMITGLKLKNRKYIIKNFSDSSSVCSIDICRNESSLSSSYFGIADYTHGFRKHTQNPEIELAVFRGKCYYGMDAKFDPSARRNRFDIFGHFDESDPFDECTSFEEMIAFLSDTGGETRHIIPEILDIPKKPPVQISTPTPPIPQIKKPEIKKLPRPWKWMMCVDKDLELWHKCLQRGIVALRPGPCASYLRQRMQPGDIVYVKHKKKMVIARGIIQPGYEFIEEEELYTRKVEWTNLSELKFNEIIVYEPLSDITRHEKAVNILEELFAKADSSKIFENDILKEEQNQKLKKIADGHQLILLKGTSKSDKKIIADFLSFYIARHAEERRIERIQAGQSSAFDSYIAGNIDLSTFGIIDPFISLVEKAKNSPFMQYAAIAENINRSNAVVLIERALSYFDKEMSEKILLKISEDAFSNRPAIPANLHIIATIDTEDKNSIIAEKLLKNMFCVYECLENL